MDRPPAVTLRLMQITDLHAAVWPWDYYLDAPDMTTGLGRLAKVIEVARSEVANALLFDTGDTLQGTPLGDVAAASDAPHPVTVALNVLGCDAGTLGNHDFDYGVDVALAATRAADYPVIVSNIDGDHWPDHALLTPVAGLTVGVVGAVPPQTAMWNAHHLAGRIEIGDIVQDIARAARRARQAGADIVLALCHSGLGEDGAEAGDENVSRAVAALPEVDVVFAGHTHETVTDHVGATPLVQAGAHGSALGLVDLTLEPRENGWDITGAEATVRPLSALPSETPAAPAILTATKAAHAATLEDMRRPIGTSDVPLHSYFALLGRDRSAALVADAIRTWGERLPGRPDLPVLGATSPFRAGGLGGPTGYTDVPAGPIARRHIAEIYFYPNAVELLEVTGAALRDWLDHAAGIYGQLHPGGGDQALILSGRATYNADAIWGLGYDLDLTRPARFDEAGVQIADSSRVAAMTLDGNPVRDSDRFLLVTNTYRGGGGGGFHMGPGARRIPVAMEPVREIVVRHVAEAGKLSPDLKGPMRFVPVAGARAILPTGPGAAAHMGDIADLAPTLSGRDETGFLRLALTL